MNPESTELHRKPGKPAVAEASGVSELPKLATEDVKAFASKGREHLAGVDCEINANGLCVRRVMQCLQDVLGSGWDRVRLLDLACGDGVYSVECALRGAQVRAIDARLERMNQGAAVARRLALNNLVFEEGDVRRVTAASHGHFDAVLFLGILYHLDVPDVFQVMHALGEMTTRVLVIDTHIALAARETVEHRGRVYAGYKYREHGSGDPEQLRRSRLLASIDNTFSFWFTRDSLVRLLLDVGFTSVWECHAPLEPGKRYDRTTMVALRGTPISLATYPWVNGRSEEEIGRLLEAERQAAGALKAVARRGLAGRVRDSANAVLHRFGFELVRRR